MPLGIVSNDEFESELINSNSEFKNQDGRASEFKGTPEIDRTSADVGTVITSDVLIKQQYERGQRGGRNEGDNNVPQSLRRLIGDTATLEGRPAAIHLASSLGISNSSVSSYTNPTNSALSDGNKADISNFLTDRKQKISKRALNKLNLAISMIDEDKLKERNAVELSNVAKNMAQVAKHMEPGDANASTSNVQFVMFAPQVKQEHHYETVVAKDNY